MSMKKKKHSQTKKPSNKEYIVISASIEDYVPFDIRSNKPMCYKENTLEPNTSSLVLQEVEEVEFITRPKEKKNTLQYYAPNNVGILLSISQKSLSKARNLYKEHLNPTKINHLDNLGDLGKRETIIKKSQIVYDFIEEIQIAIVFGFNALEAFVNLSIPNNYEYRTSPTNKGIVEIYDKKAIERWTNLQTKLGDILVNIYETSDIRKTKLWNNFLEFEKMRNEITHQKSIGDTDFYKKYLKGNTFTFCECPSEIIKFFYQALEDQNRTNPLWPWVIDRDASLPVSYDYDPSNFEIIGNIFEGKQ